MGLGWTGGGGVAGGYDALAKILIQRKLEAQQAFENQRQLAGDSRADRQLSNQEAALKAASERQASLDKETQQQHAYTEANSLADQIPPGQFLGPLDPAVGRLQTGGRGSLLQTQESRPAIETGPLQPGDTGAAKPQGFIKTASQKQLDTNADNARQAAKDEQTAAYQNDMLGIRGEMNDIRAQAVANAGQRQNSMTPAQAFRATRDMQTAWGKSVKPVREIAVHVQRMDQALAEAQKPGANLNAPSQVIISEFNKILDPTSVVRESEYSRSPEGAPLMNRIQGFAQKIAQGGAGLTPADLQAMVGLAKQMAAGMSHYADADKRRLTKVADRYGIDPADVFDEGDLGTGTDAHAPVAGPATGGGVRKRYNPATGKVE